MVEINIASEHLVETKRNKNKRKDNKVMAIVWAFLYLILTVTLCVSGTRTFVQFYYYPIYISGNSMEPTLNGGSEGTNRRYDFGFIDTHKAAIDSIDRFDIITTFYPFSAEDYPQPYEAGSKLLNNAKHKIKRVIAVPGDTFTIANNVLIFRDAQTGEDEVCDLPFEIIKSDGTNRVDFKTKGYGDSEGFVTLNEDEYWVMGDNWVGSRDSYSDQKGGPVYYENIVGVLVAIVGTCNVINDEIVDKKYTTPRFFK